VVSQPVSRSGTKTKKRRLTHGNKRRARRSILCERRTNILRQEVKRSMKMRPKIPAKCYRVTGKDLKSLREEVERGMQIQTKSTEKADTPQTKCRYSTPPFSHHTPHPTDTPKHDQTQPRPTVRGRSTQPRGRDGLPSRPRLAHA
jgi:hypothetical protein